ncbi:kif1, putative [Schistosoma mansoni]|uniref:kif1, putative n=1 Tax=Schistosoma mansoni TaxID=6183 RepID=UPI0001A63FF8|nr:kif1, putative [Schistosoma mansoni]|eukprot:XP_018644162.1 kif1, putative [Schistosoma mansoni]
MSEEQVKVAVRIRPFNKRERERNAELIVFMNGNTTTIRHPERIYTFFRSKHLLLSNRV